MDHRERVQTALAHRTPDRVPLEMSFTPEFAARLRSHLFGAAGGGHNPHGGGNTYELERALDLDVLLTSVGWANNYYAGDRYNPGGETYTDEWGVGWKNVPYDTRFGRGFYTEMDVHPLADDDAIAGYRAPDPHRPELYAPTRRVLEQFGRTHWICGSCQTTILETATALRGYEQILVDMLTDEDLAGRLFDLPQQYHLEVTKELVRLGVDMIWLGDDIGAQQSMIIAPDLWRRLLKPRFAALIAELKRINPAVVVAYHTDGQVEPVMPDLIEIGVQVLHPIQPLCMDPAALKRRFGDHLTFMGTVDEQSTLPFGTPEQVKAEVLERLRTVGRGGGLILAPTHHVQLDTPIENLLAMVETARTTPMASLR